VCVKLEKAIRTRRTHKAYGPDAVAPAVLDELFELARWAPNHHVTNPWRFRVLGERTREQLMELAEDEQPGSAVKLRRAPTLVAATSGGDSFSPGDHNVFYVKNGSGASINVTIDVTATVYGLAAPDITVAIPAGDEAFLGPYPAGEVAQGSTGLCDVTYSAVTTVTVAVLTF